MRAQQRARTGMCARLALIAIPLLAALALGQDGAIERATFVRMDDGVRLNTSVFIPDGPEPRSGWPAIVFVHGLGGSKTIAAARRAAGRGYVGLAYTVRGQGRREGGHPSDGLSTPVGDREAQDLRAMLAWLQEQHPVNPDRIGITGSSQGGLHAWMALAHGMRVAAAIPQNFTADVSRAVLINGGINPNAVIPSRSPLAYNPATIRNRRKWISAYDVPAMRSAVSKRDLRERLRGTRVPVMVQFAFEDGWGSPNNVIADFRALAGPKKLYLGTGGHGSPNVNSERDFRQRWADRWFDRWLKDVPNGIDAEPAVEVAMQGSWHHVPMPSFPPPATQMINYYLVGKSSKDGDLAREDLVDRTEYLKRNSELQGVAGGGALTAQTLEHRARAGFGGAGFYAAGARLYGDRGALARWQLDSLRFSTPPLGRDLALAGIPEVQLAIEGTAAKRQVALRLWDVERSTGRRRLLSRASLTTDRPEPDGHAVRIQLNALAYRVPAGNTIELEISNLDLDWDFESQRWRKLRAIPVFEGGALKLHTGEWLFSLLRLPEFDESAKR